MHIKYWFMQLNAYFGFGIMCIRIFMDFFLDILKLCFSAFGLTSFTFSTKTVSLRAKLQRMTSCFKHNP